MKSHAEIQERLSAYCGGDLEPAEQQLVEEHLAECPDCRAELVDLQISLRLIRSTPEVDPPPWLTTRIMARIKGQQAGKRSWLQRMFFPLHIKLPLEAIALLMVCVSGYYLSRTVETNLEQTARRKLQEPPAQQAPIPSPHPAQQPAGMDKTDLRTAGQPQTAVPPASAPQPDPRTEALPAKTGPAIPPAPAPGPYAPAPPAYRDRYGGSPESMKAAPAAEFYNRAREAAPETKQKSGRSLERQRDAAAPAAAGRAAGAPAGPALPQAMIRLNVDDPAAAPALIREALLRSGGTVDDERELPGRRFKAHIPAARIQELFERLERMGRITEHPALTPGGSQLLEITIQW
jgi:hypothetical protein